jgi:hypothetical protein
MSNVNAPNGLRPVRHLTGGTIRMNAYTIASAYNTSIYQGDVVVMTGTGRDIAAQSAGGHSSIGVFAGCVYHDATGRPVWSHWYPASTTDAAGITAWVYDDPMTIFEVQADSAAAGDIAALADFNAGAGGSTLTGVSGEYMTVTGATGTSGKAFRLLSLVNRADNAYGQYAKLEVIFVDHALLGIASGAGGN